MRACVRVCACVGVCVCMNVFANMAVIMHSVWTYCTYRCHLSIFSFYCSLFSSVHAEFKNSLGKESILIICTLFLHNAFNFSSNRERIAMKVVIETKPGHFIHVELYLFILFTSILEVRPFLLR